MMNCTRYKTSQSNVAPSDGGRTEALVPLWVMRAIPAARSGDDGSRHPRPLQQLLPVRPELAVRVYVPIERLAGDAELGAQLADLSAGLADGGLRQAELGRGHLERPAAVTTAGACRSQAGAGTFDDQLALELGESGKMPNIKRPLAVVVSRCAP